MQSSRARWMLRHHPKWTRTTITGRHSGQIGPMMEGWWWQGYGYWKTLVNDSICHPFIYEGKWQLLGWVCKHCWGSTHQILGREGITLILRHVYQLHILSLLSNPLIYAIALHLAMEPTWFPTVCVISHNQALLEAACSICVSWRTKGRLLPRSGCFCEDSILFCR